MSIFSADLTPSHAVSFLWAAPAIPAAAAAVLALGGRALERRFGRGAVAGLTVAALGASAGIVVAAVFGVLFAAPPGGWLLVDAAGALADVGGVLIAATLSLDRHVAAPALAIALAGATAAVAYAGSSTLAKQPAIDLVATCRALAAAVAGGLVVALADNLLVVLVGWEALVLGSLALIAARRAPEDAQTTDDTARALVVSRVGQMAWLAGLVLLLWGLTMPGTAGPSFVRADVRGIAGAGIEMPTLGDRPTAASLRRIPVGATLGFQEIATQLALRDTAERRPFQEALAARRLGPLPLLPFVYLGLLFGVAALGVAVLVGRPTVCVAVAMLAAVAALLARSWPVLVLSPGALIGAALACVGVLVAWVRAARTGRSLSSTILSRAAHELGVLPVRDFARGAAWLERLWRPLAWVITVAAGIVALVVAAMALRGPAYPAPVGDGPAPRLVITPSSLSFSAPGEARTVTLANAGDDVLRLGPVGISSSGARGSSDFTVAALSTGELEPGASATVTITYRPPANAIPAQAFAALLVPAEDPRLPTDLDLRTGAPIARRLAGVPLRAGQTHTLTWMILLPLLGAALVAFGPARRSRALARAAAAASLLLGAWVIARFDPTFSLADGNGGLQLMARATLIRALGFQYFVGVDGVSLLFVLLAPVVGAVALARRGDGTSEEAPRGSLAAVLLVQAGATGVFVSHDGLLLVIFWAVAAAGLALLAGRGRRGVGVAALASAALLLLAMVALHGHSRPSLLVDGTAVAHTFDVARLASSTTGAASLVPTAAWGVLLVALAFALPLFPFATPAAALGAAPLGLLWSGLFSEMALYGLARVGIGLASTVRPVAWTILLLVGAVGAVRAALLATREDGVEGLAARAGEVRTSIAIVGLASLTPAGIAGALLLAFAHGLVAALMFVLGGSSGAAPRGRLARVLALAASLGVPGLAAFAGASIVVAAVTPQHPGLAIAVLAAFAILTGAHARVGVREVAIEPAPVGFDRRALVLAVPLGLIVLALGLVPAPALTAIALGVLDLVRGAAS